MNTRRRGSGLSNPELTLPLSAVVMAVGSLVLPWISTVDTGGRSLLALSASAPLVAGVAVLGAVSALVSLALSAWTNRMTLAIVIGAVSALAAVTAWGLTPLEVPIDSPEVRRHMGGYLLLFGAGLSLAGAISQRTRRATAAASDDAARPPAA